MRALLILASGCSLLNAFPDPIEEVTPELCADGLDNDVDDIADCADPSCDGSCLEDTIDQCGDARDNDADGRIDLDDPLCWPFADFEVTRCSSVDGVEFVEDFSDELRVVSEWYPAFGELVVTGSGLDVGSNRDVGTRAVFWNQWDDLELRIEVADLTSLVVSFAPEELAPADQIFAPNARDFFTIAFLDYLFIDCPDPQSCTMTEGVEAIAIVEGAETRLGLAHPSVGPQRITIAIRDQEATVRLEGLDPPASAQYSVSLANLEPRPFRLLLGGSAGTTILDEVSLTTELVHPCGAPTPQIPPNGIVGDPLRDFDVGSSIGSAANPDGVTCALALSCQADLGMFGLSALVSWRSEDGQRWERAESEVFADRPAGGIIWNDAEEWWEVAAPWFIYDDTAGREIGMVTIAYSRDCREWNLLAETEFPYITYGTYCSALTIAGESASYVARDDPEGQRLELFDSAPVVECEEQGLCFVVRWELQRAELRDREWRSVETWRMEELEIAPPVHITAIGSDLVAIFHRPPGQGIGIGMMVLGSGEWRKVPGFTWGASRIPGTFDSADVFSGHVFSRNGELTLMYSGIGDYYVHPLTGGGHVSVGLAPLRVVHRGR